MTYTPFPIATRHTVTKSWTIQFGVLSHSFLLQHSTRWLKLNYLAGSPAYAQNRTNSVYFYFMTISIIDKSCFTCTRWHEQSASRPVLNLRLPGGVSEGYWCPYTEAKSPKQRLSQIWKERHHRLNPRTSSWSTRVFKKAFLVLNILRGTVDFRGGSFGFAVNS